MNIKQFIDWRKILIFVILILVTSAIRNLFIVGADIGANYGFPFNFYGYGGGPPLSPGQAVPSYFDYGALVGNIIVWYIVSFLIVFVYDKVRRKK
jgi:hypothetical protein